MPAQGRLGDKAQIAADAHGCPGCPHPGVGPAISGSANVNVNSRPALRVGDAGMHAACCGPNTWTAQAGSASVFINGKAAHRMNDANQHCGGMGKLIEGSNNVFVGDASGGGAGGGVGGGGASGGGGTGGGAAASWGPAGGGQAGGGGGSASGGAQAVTGAGGATAGSASSDAVGAAGASAWQPRDRFVLAVEVSAIGDVPAAGELIQIVDSKSGEVVTATYADAAGRVRVSLPDDKPYHLMVGDDGRELVEMARMDTDPAAESFLRCQFVDRDGVPLVGEPVKVTGDGRSLTVDTSTEGHIDLHAAHGEYEVEIAGKRWKAHTRRAGDYDPAAHPSPYYQFVVEDDEPHEPVDFESERLHRHRVSDDEPLE